MNIKVVQVRVSLFTRNMADEAIARVDEEYSGTRSPIFFFFYLHVYETAVSTYCRLFIQLPWCQLPETSGQLFKQSLS